jgi:hypothetical protein
LTSISVLIVLGRKIESIVRICAVSAESEDTHEYEELGNRPT